MAAKLLSIVVTNLEPFDLEQFTRKRFDIGGDLEARLVIGRKYKMADDEHTHSKHCYRLYIK